MSKNYTTLFAGTAALVTAAAMETGCQSRALTGEEISSVASPNEHSDRLMFAYAMEFDNNYNLTNFLTPYHARVYDLRNGDIGVEVFVFPYPQPLSIGYATSTGSRYIYDRYPRTAQVRFIDNPSQATQFLSGEIGFEEAALYYANRPGGKNRQMLYGTANWTVQVDPQNASRVEFDPFGVFVMTSDDVRTVLPQRIEHLKSTLQRLQENPGLLRRPLSNELAPSMYIGSQTAPAATTTTPGTTTYSQPYNAQQPLAPQPVQPGVAQPATQPPANWQNPAYQPLPPRQNER